MLEVGELNDATFVVDLGRDEADPTDDRVFSESLRQKINVAHAVEHRKDHRSWSNGRSEIVHRRLQRVGFHAQEHEVVRCLDLRSGDYFWSDDRVTMWADDTKTILAEVFRASWTNKESHIASGLGKPAAKIAANRTGADDKNAHSRGNVLS